MSKAELEPHQQRVVEEHQELAERRAKLMDFIDGTVFAQMEEIDQTLLARQAGVMKQLMHLLDQRIQRFYGMKRYTCHKQVQARPMSRGVYNKLQGWELPVEQDPLDEGYLVEYLDGGTPNHKDFQHYISWSPKDVFEAGYTENE